MSVLETVAAYFNVDQAAPSPVFVRASRHRELLALWRTLGYHLGVEVGTEQGRYAEEICRAIPDVALTCVDPYREYSRYEQHQTQDKMDRYYADAQARLAPYRAQIWRMTSLEAAATLPDAVLDFVFIDANHAYEYVKADIEAWAPKVRPGGIVSGHDYKPEGQERKPLPFGVIQAVTEYTAAHAIRPYFVLRKDRCPTWLWVKS